MANNVTTKKLIEAIALIGMIENTQVSAIQFEDGSGYKFNYQINGSAEWKFIDFSRTNLLKYWNQLHHELARLTY